MNFIIREQIEKTSLKGINILPHSTVLFAENIRIL
jgi:hypothetical protein